jgi:methylglutaconyl-CoA hydratase
MKTITVQDQGEKITITLNRPERRNAFDSVMINELTMAFKEVNKNLKVRILHLTGSGESFCSGADLEWMRSMKNFSFEQNLEDSKALFEMFETLAMSPVPITAIVKGHVMGGANGILSMCDVVAAEKSTQFAFSEVKLGLVPAVISPFILSKMKKSSARNLMITGRIFSAQEAYDGGLIEFVGTVNEIESYMDQIHKALSIAGPEAVRETIQLISHVDNCYDWQEVKSITTKTIANKRVSVEGQEGLNAFFEKRKPNWVK